VVGSGASVAVGSPGRVVGTGVGVLVGLASGAKNPFLQISKSAKFAFPLMKSVRHFSKSALSILPSQLKSPWDFWQEEEVGGTNVGARVKQPLVVQILLVRLQSSLKYQ